MEVESDIHYRQVHPTGGNPPYYKRENSLGGVVDRTLFYPTKDDEGGLSFICAKHRTEIWSAYRVQRPDVRYFLANIPLSLMIEIANECQIADFEMSETKDALDDINGEPIAHRDAVRISAKVRFGEDKLQRLRIKQWAEKLAIRINATHITGQYEVPIEGVHPYRP